MEYRLAIEGARLAMHHRKLEPVTLEPTFRDAFRAGGRSLIFTCDSRGRVDGFRMSTGRVWGVRFGLSGR